MTVNIYSQEFGTDENDDNYEEFELVFAFETPLALTYGMINGSDINCSPGAVSHCSPAGCVFQGLLGFIFCAEPVYYYKENEHFFGIELSGGLGDEFVIVATYTEGTIFSYPIRRISAGCRFRIEG